MMSKAIEQAINEQIKQEFSSAYVYLSMSAYFERLSLPGFAHWSRLQSQEEVVHGLRLFDYMNDRGGTVRLHAVDQPPSDFSSPLDVFERALKQERHVTKLIHELYELAVSEKDHATQVALQWFINEQVEEEKAGSEIVERLKMVGDNRTGLLILDSEMVNRQPEAAQS